MGLEPVISFFIEANPFSGICLFCIFVTNTIYVMEIEMLGPVVLARNHNIYFGSKSSFFVD
jgi:hypothetical protein